MALSDYSRALVYAVPKILNFPEVRDQGIFNAPLLKAFKSLGGWKEEETAKELLATIQYRRSNFITVTDPVSSAFIDLSGTSAGDTIADNFRNAKYQWWTKYGRIIIPERDIDSLANVRPEANAYVSNNLKTFMKSWGVDLENSLIGWDATNNRLDPVSGGVANSPWGTNTNPANILYWVDGPAGTTPSYFPYNGAVTSQTSGGTWKPPGDIDRSPSVNTFWNSVHVRPSSAEQLTFQKLVYPMLLINSRGEPMPNLIIVNVAAFAYFQNTLISSQQWVNVETADKTASVGFLALRVLNALCIPHEKFDYIYDGTAVGSNGSSANAARNTILYLNTDSLKIYAGKEIKASPVELPHPVMFWKTTRNVALWADNLRCHGRYTNWYV